MTRGDEIRKSRPEREPGETPARSGEPIESSDASGALPAPPALPSDYEVLSELGRGAMGVVYRARHKPLGRDVAVKVIRPEDASSREMLDRFRKEARSMARLRHPHIVPVHEVGETGGCLYFTMDLIDGEPLSKAIGREAMAPARAARLVRQVTEAVAHSHRQGVIHRDLKPGNILVDGEGNAYVTDFGLALAAGEGSARMTQTGTILGTPSYMAPEQAAGETQRVGERTDVYALGVILYECLTGCLPFTGTTVAAVVHMVIHDDPVPPRRLVPSVPRDLEAVCLKAMEKEPERRYATAAALAEDLKRYEEGKPVGVRPSGAIGRLRKAYRRNRVAFLSAAGSAVAALVLGVTVGGALLRDRPGPLAAEAERLHDAGDHAAAWALLDRAWRSIDSEAGRPPTDEPAIPRRGEHVTDRSPRYPEARRIFDALLRCSLEHIDDLVRRGSADRAWEILEGLIYDAARVTEYHPARIPELWWHAARVKRAQGDEESARRALRIIDDAIAFQHGTRDLVDAGGEGARHRMVLEWLGPALANPGDPGHGFATEQLEEIWWRSPASVRTWLESHPDLARPIVAALVSRPLDSRAEPRVFCTLAGAVGGLAWAPIREDLLDAIERDARADAPSPVRTGARRMLRHVGDLPIGDDSDPDLTALWGETKRLSRPESFRRKVEFALGRSDRYAAFWLEAHVGPVPPPSPERDAWWAERRNGDPRDWVGSAAGLAASDSRDLDSLLARFLDTDRGHPRRALLHHLIRLNLPEDLPDGPLDEPGEGLALDWIRILGRGEAWTLRYAVYDQSDGIRPGRLVESRRAAVWLGEHLRLSVSSRTIRRRPECLGRAQTETRTVDLILPGDWTDPWALSAWSGAPTLRFAQGGGLSVLYVVEPTSHADNPWAAEEWTRVAARNLERLAGGIETEGRDFVSRNGNSVQRLLLSILAVPPRGAEAEVARASEAARGVDAGFAQALGYTRLLLGDEDLLADDAWMEEIRAPLSERTLLKTHSKWARLAVVTPSPRVRAYALERSRQEEQEFNTHQVLCEVVLAGELDPPAWLLGALLREAGVALALLGAILSALVVLTLRASRRALTLEKRLRAAERIVLLGLLSILASDNVPLLPPFVLAVGTFLLATWGRGGLRHAVPGVFLAAAAADLLSVAHPEMAAIRTFSFAALGAGVAGLGFLAASLDPDSPGAHRRRPLRWAGALALTLGAALVVAQMMERGVINPTWQQANVGGIAFILLLFFLVSTIYGCLSAAVRARACGVTR